MINTQVFKHTHFYMLIEMLKNQGFERIDTVTYKSLPKIGYITTIGKQPVAAGFLRRVEGRFGMLDGLTSNPYFGSQIRHEGIQKIVDSIIEEAKALKLNGIIAFTHDSSVIKRALSIGFKTTNESVITMTW